MFTPPPSIHPSKTCASYPRSSCGYYRRLNSLGQSFHHIFTIKIDLLTGQSSSPKEWNANRLCRLVMNISSNWLCARCRYVLKLADGCGTPPLFFPLGARSFSATQQTRLGVCGDSVGYCTYLPIPTVDHKPSHCGTE